MIADLVIQHAPDVLDVETPDAAALHRGALFMVGGVNQIIENWLEDPQETPAQVAAVCADLCVAVVRGITQP